VAEHSVYVDPDVLGPAARPPSDERLRRILADIPVTVGRSGLILVLTGQPGTASVIAQAIDESTLSEQVGTVAGDNTLIVLFPDEAQPGSLARAVPRDPWRRSSRRPHGGPFPMNKVVLAYSAASIRRSPSPGSRSSTASRYHAHRRPRRGSIPEGVERRAMAAGASTGVRRGRAARRSSSRYCWPALQANALYQGAYPLATALARPLIAQLLVEVAQKEGAEAVAHGCTGKGNDQVRFDVAVHALDPGLQVIAPMRVGMGLTREQSIDYANARGIELPITKASPYSIDVNLWGRSCETGVLEDPWVTPPDDAYAWTVAPSGRPRTRSSW